MTTEIERAALSSTTLTAHLDLTDPEGDPT